MAFIPKDFTLAVDSIAGGSLRIFFYKTTDTLATVMAAGYAVGAAEYGARLGDIVLVYIEAEVPQHVVVRVDAIDENGTASFELEPDSSLALKEAVFVATTDNIALAGLQTIDGTPVPVGKRVLVKDQGNGAENGIWVSASGPWERAVDFASTNDIANGTMVFVTNGTENVRSFWYVANTEPVIIGVSDIVFLRQIGEVELTAIKNAAEAARDRAEEWAENPEDDPVTGSQYSAKHHALKAAASAIAAGLSAQAAAIAAPLYADTTDGLAGTANGGFFFVKGSNGGEIVAKLYKDNDGVAEDQELDMPSVAAYEAIVETVDPSLETAGRQRAVLKSYGGFCEPIAMDGAVMLPDGALRAGDWDFAIESKAAGVVPEIATRSFAGFVDVAGRAPEDEMDVEASGSTSGEALWTTAQYDYAQADVEEERLRLMSVDLSAIKRVATGIRGKPRTGQSFEARDNIARLFLSASRLAIESFIYHAASIGPDVAGVSSGTTFVPFNSDSRDFWFLREQWTAGTGTDTVYTAQEVIDGDFLSNSRGGGPAPISCWARQWLSREYNIQSQSAAITTSLDVVWSTAKAEGTTAEVYDGDGRDRAIDAIRVLKEAVANNTVAAGDTALGSRITLQGSGASIGIECFHNLHGQRPNTDGETGYEASIQDFIAAYAAVLSSEISQSEPFAFTMMQPGAVGWGTLTNVICDQMVEMADDVTGDSKYIFLIGAMWDIPSFETVLVGSGHPDYGNGHPLLGGNIMMGCRQGIAEHYIIDRNENFWMPKPMDGYFAGNRFLIPICTKFPGLHEAKINVGVTPTLQDHLGFSIETSGGSQATITSIRVVPGYDLVEGETAEDLSTYTVARTGRNNGTTHLGIVNVRDGFTCNLPVKIPFTKDQTRAIGGYVDDPTSNGYGRYLEDIPGYVGEIDWGNPVAIRTFALTAMPSEI